MDTNSGSLTEDIAAGKIKLHELDAKLGPAEATKERIRFLEHIKGIDLKGISLGGLDPATCRPNIENMIGSVQLPLGIAGPVKIKGEYAKGDFYLPLATTEGALVASVNRGTSAINKAGGADTVVLEDNQARSILMVADSLEKVKGFSLWVKENFENLKKVGEEGEPYIHISSIGFHSIGINVWLRIKASTSDAMGMNMITIAGKKIGQYAEKESAGIRFVSESGNMCSDKKPAAINLISSRGKKVSASVDIPEEIIKEYLKTHGDSLIDMNYRKNLLGSAASSSLGFNGHFANVIAAIFIATGQDAAHVVDGSLGFTTAEKSEKGVLFTVTLPALQVGTIGGGTGLMTQKECLRIMGVEGTGVSNSKKLAEIIAAAALAGEISLLAALCTKDLSNAHVSLNR
jgi:hydroxymethylglutaryl-CoA reductase (NADPH)